jgi:hypothetical protein
MFEIVQILWDLFVMRRDIQQGRLTLRRAAIAFGMTIVAYGTAVGAFVLYDRHRSTSRCLSPARSSPRPSSSTSSTLDFTGRASPGLSSRRPSQPRPP